MLQGLPTDNLQSSHPAGLPTIVPTPLVAIQLHIQDRVHTIHLKLESANPTGSMKDRTALALFKHLQSQHSLTKETVIIESTSGNLGIALAHLCQHAHHRFIAVIDPKTTVENVQRMQALGAQIEHVTQPDQTGGYLLSRLEHVKRLCQQHPNYLWTDQYHNLANPAIHYLSTGPEVYQQMEQRVDAIFVPVSTGGTLAGIGRFFKEVSPKTQVIGVDAHGSVIFGTPPAPRKLTGIGSSRPSEFLRPHLYDSYQLVTDQEAFISCRELYQRTGIQVGGSSGAVLAACATYLMQHPDCERIVCICADQGKNYASTIFNDQWLVEHAKIDLNRAQTDLTFRLK